MASRIKRQRISDDGDAVTTAVELAGDFHDPQGNDSDREHTSPKQKLPKSLFVHSLPLDVTTENLTEHFSQSYPLKHATVVLDKATKQSKCYGFVTFADAEDAQKAQEEFDGTTLQGRKIKIDIAKLRHRDVNVNNLAGPKQSQPSTEALKNKVALQRERDVDQKPLKLIVRNLPWSIKEPEQLAMLFRSYGKVKHVTVPKQKSGLSPGFGFVVLRGRKNVEKALAGVNGMVVEGRTLAVDWAIEKDAWQTLNKQDKSRPTDEIEPLSDLNGSAERSRDYSDPAADGSVSDASEQSEDEKGYLSATDELEDGSHLDPTSGIQSQLQKQPDRCTLFIRNLPFTTTDESLFEHFKPFGHLRYARVVMDHETGRPRGTGFVCFIDEEDAINCLRKAPKHQNASRPRNAKDGRTAMKNSVLQDTLSDPLGLFTVEDRVLRISRAVNRDEAHRLTVEGASLRFAQDQDKRRLYLLSEGIIPSNSSLYASLAPSEARLREESAKQRQALIKSNPSLHLSLTRLSVRNIPRNIGSKDLKALAREAVVGFAKDVKDGRRLPLSKEELSRGGDEMKEAEKNRKAKGRGIVKQAKVLFEGREGSKVSESSGAGKSRGYGFIEYSSHRWALMGLRYLNGRADHAQRDTGPGSLEKSRAKSGSKRLIVEFAIENAQVVARRRERESKARERSRVVESGKDRGEKSQLPDSLADTAKQNAGRRKRKRDGGAREAPNPDSSESNVKTKRADKASQRQRIIGKKRALRKASKVLSG